MNEKKQRRFPSDRIKLHELLNKRSATLERLTEEVAELREAVTEADHLEIISISDSYQVTPEMLKTFVEALQSGVISHEQLEELLTRPALDEEAIIAPESTQEEDLDWRDYTEDDA